MRLAGGDDGLGFALDQMIHDRQIVRREVPDHVAIVLKESQVYARGIVIIKISQRSVIEQFVNLLTAPVNRKV